MEWSIKNDEQIAQASKKFCEQVPEGVLFLPERQETVILPVECLTQVKAWSHFSSECYISKKETLNKMRAVYRHFQEYKAYIAPGGRESVKNYSHLLKEVDDQIKPSLERTNQLIQQREEVGRLMGLDATSLTITLLPTIEELVKRLSARFVLCLAQADDLAHLPNVGAQQDGALPSGSGFGYGGGAPYHGYSGAPSQVGGFSSGSGYAGGAPYHGYGGAPSQVGGFSSGSGYAGGAPYHGYGGAPSQVGGFSSGSGYAGGGPSQGLVTLPPQGAPGGASTPSVSTWMVPSCLETLEFPYIWLMTPFSVLCAFYSDPGSLLEMLGTLTLPDPFDLLWIVVKNALIRSIKAILMTYLMVLLYNFIQRVKSFFQRKRKSKSLYILFFYGFIE